MKGIKVQFLKGSKATYQFYLTQCAQFTEQHCNPSVHAAAAMASGGAFGG